MDGQTGNTKLAGLALASFVLCVTIVVLRVAALAVYVKAVGDIPGFKLDIAAVGLGVAVLGFYVWSAVGIMRRDPRAYRRLTRLSLVFGVLQIATVAYNVSSLPPHALSLIHEAMPMLWAVALPVPLALAALHLVTAFVAYRANATLVPSDEYAFK